MPSLVREYRGHRIAIYSPSDHFAVVTPPGGNRVIDFKGRQARSSVVEGPLVCLDRAQALIDGLLGEAGCSSTLGKSSACGTVNGWQALLGKSDDDNGRS